jgi:hypothetical protein
VFDLSPIVQTLEQSLEACATGRPGEVRRWTGPGPGRDLAPNPYGCADAANLLYTVGRFPAGAHERTGFTSALQAFQDPETGFFREGTHHEIHVTAHCAAALELFEELPVHPLRALGRLDEPGALETFLDELAWRDDPWLASHQGAGVYAARVLAREASSPWEDRYFTWLDDACDSATGLWRRGCLARPYRWGESRFPHLAGTFHYLFNYEHARRAHPYPASLIDTCLSIFAEGEWPLGRTVSFAEIDWVYCLSRAMRQSSHRRDEGEGALREFAARYVPFLEELDWSADDGGSDLHRVFGVACALSELQRAVPGMLRSPRPLRLVLDRRPFI